MLQVLRALDSIHKKMLDLVSPIDEQSFSNHYSPDRWSVAENIHHLYLVEKKYVKLLEQELKSQSRRMGYLRGLLQVPPWVVGLRIIRVKVPERAVEPLDAPPKAAALDNYNRVRSELKAIAQEQGQARLRSLAIPHPILGMFDGVNVVHFLGYHEMRHYKQILEMMG